MHEDDELLSIDEAATILHAPVATLRYWRYLGTGPNSFKVGRSVRYLKSDLFAWLTAQAVDGTGASTGQPRRLEAL